MAIGETVEVSRDTQKAAVETIELYRNDQEMVVDAFDRVVVDLFMDSQANGHKTFMICSCNAGVGSTSIAMELAISLSVAGWRTVLIDGDLRKEAQYKKHNLKVKAGLILSPSRWSWRTSSIPPTGRGCIISPAATRRGRRRSSCCAPRGWAS